MPQFAVAIVCAALCLAIYLRSWKAIFAPESLIAAALALLYAASVVAFYPEFFTVMGPLVRDVYIGVGLSFPALLEKPGLPIWGVAILAMVLLKRHDKIDPACLLLLAASLGFAVVFLLQRKGWPYHSYPMIALALLPLGHALVSNAPRTAIDRAFRIGAMALFAVLFVRSMLWFNFAFDARPLQAAVAWLGPNPKILAITAEPGLGHPLVRALDGVWVSRQQGLWVDAYLKYMRKHGVIGPQADPVLDAYAVRERAMLIEDFKRIRPSVVLVDDLTGDWSEWLRSHPDVSGLLSDYQPGGNHQRHRYSSRRVDLPSLYRGWMPSRTARKRGNALVQLSRGEQPMMRIEVCDPKRSHCTIVTGVLSLPLMASIRVS